MSNTRVESVTLNPAQVQNLRREHEAAQDRDFAHLRAALDTAARIRDAVGSIQEMNFGEAKDILEALLEELPSSDSPGMGYRAFERALEATAARRRGA